METIYFAISLLCFWLKGEIRHEQNFITLTRPNTIMGIFPFGEKRDSVAVKEISSVETNFKFSLFLFLAGSFLAGIGVMLFGTGITEGRALLSLFSLPVILFGVSTILWAFDVRLIIKTTASDFKIITFLIFEKRKAYQAEVQIRQLISDRMSDTNTREQTDRIIDAIEKK